MQKVKHTIISDHELGFSFPTISFSKNENLLFYFSLFMIFALVVLCLITTSYTWTYVFISFFVCTALLFILYRKQKRIDALVGAIIKEKLSTRILTDAQKTFEDDSIELVDQKFFDGFVDNDNIKCYLCYFSNGKALSYTLTKREGPNKNCRYYTLELNPEIVTTQELYKESRPQNSFLLSFGIETRLKIEIVSIFLYGIIIFGIVFTLAHYLGVSFFYGILVSFFIINVVLSDIKANNSTLKHLRRIIYFIDYYCFIKIIPVLAIIAIGCVAVFLSAAAPISICMLLRFFSVSITPATEDFLFLSLGTCILVHGSSVWRYIIKNALASKNITSDKYPSLALAFYVLQGKNLNFIVYLAYLSFHFCLAIFKFQNIGDMTVFSSSIDPIITYSFLVHIAFTNMVAKKKDTDIKLEPMLQYLDKSFFPREDLAEYKMPKMKSVSK